ncbi:hypothetical protein [Coralliovum pocilloporae]|uniref:hypothetical protein n=1 Tax=Coralliovum pocilloporae TaxID=3066369 RepID=UPI00330717DF
MTRLIDDVVVGLQCNLSQIAGYSDKEIEKIESFYSIKVGGDFRLFLQEFGRSSGDVLLPDLIFYQGYYAAKTPAMISGHLAQQFEFREDLIRNNRPFRSGSPFLISIESETQFFFLRTRADEPIRVTTVEDDYGQLSDNPEIVYHFDENTGMVSNTKRTFREYLKSQVRLSETERVGTGEMIKI